MFSATLRRAFLISLLPFLAAVVVFTVLNTVPGYEEDVDWDSPFGMFSYAKEWEGYPNAYGVRTKFVANPHEIFGDGGTLRHPRFAPPRWEFKDEFDGEKLSENVRFCGYFSLWVWFVSAVGGLVWGWAQERRRPCAEPGSSPGS